MKDLIIGDIHATPDELDDVYALMLLVEHVARTHSPDRIVFLGDLHHTFSITNVKVMAFYRDWFRKLGSDHGRGNVFALAGNHDMPGNGRAYPHALLPYEDYITVVGAPYLHDNTLFLPYYADPNLFHKAVDEHKPRLIYCHQEFNGAQYDNGYFAPHGADPAKMKVETISGHIHTPQRLGEKVWYPGAPRWRTVSDANINRNLYLVDGDSILHEEDTGKVCKQIWACKYSEDKDAPELPTFYKKDEYRFYIEGGAEFVKAKLALLRSKYPGARITTNVKSATVRVRESDGIDVAFRKFAKEYKPKNGTPPELILERAIPAVYGEHREA